MTDVTGAGGVVTGRLLSLGNDVLKVEQASEDAVNFQCNSESKGFLGKKQHFEARMKVDQAKKEIRYWEKIGETSKGLGSDADMGYGKPSFVLKGLERSGTGEGFIPDGGKFKYDLGKVEDLVKSIAKENGWGFKKSILKP
ncbi:MAG TPA: hypothetical protein VF478_01000 [Anaerolineae bacterium]